MISDKRISSRTISILKMNVNPIWSTKKKKLSTEKKKLTQCLYEMFQVTGVWYRLNGTVQLLMKTGHVHLIKSVLYRSTNSDFRLKFFSEYWYMEEKANKIMP